jgi:hypothetical protein
MKKNSYIVLGKGAAHEKTIVDVFVDDYIMLADASNQNICGYQCYYKRWNR